MSKTYFAFKQFAVRQDKSSMKIGTDSVLIGSWSSIKQSKLILDIGTGTGVISLMLAQRSKQAMIDAIDIDEASYLQATENFRDSPWHGRIKCFHSSLQCFKPASQYDLIVSNPPYFALPDQFGEKRSSAARYTQHLSFKELAEGVIRLLKPNGRFCVIFPVHEAAMFTNEAEKRRLYLTRYVWVKTTTRKKVPKRVLMEFELTQREPIEDKILVLQDEGKNTPEFQSMVKDFYLK